MTNHNIIFGLALSGLLTGAVAQNIGIGTSTPTRARLELHGGVGRTAAIFGGEGPGISIQKEFPAVGYNQYFDGEFSRYMGNGFAAVTWFNPGLGILNFDMFPNGAANAIGSGSRVMTITSTGNVGIGNAVVNAQLQLNNELRNRKIVLYQTVNNDHQYYGFGIENGALRYSVDAPGAAHRFYSGISAGSSNILMTIQGDKKVLISNNGGGGFLAINFDVAPYTLSIKQAANTGIFIQEAASGTNWHLRAQWFPSNSLAIFALDHNGARKGYFMPTGEYVWGSDRRLKTNIQPLPPTLDKVMQLKPSVYELISNNAHHEKTMGFIAQEVKPLFPELVFESENERLDGKGMTNMHALSYAGFGIIAIKAIQEQQELILQLRRENEVLKRRMDALERKERKL